MRSLDALQLGRGTRLCPDLFGPGHDKEHFYPFDYCQNLEYFSQDIAGTEGFTVESLGKRLFDARLELISALDGSSTVTLREKAVVAVLGEPHTNDEVRRAVAQKRVVAGRHGADAGIDAAAIAG